MDLTQCGRTIQDIPFYSIENICADRFDNENGLKHAISVSFVSTDIQKKFIISASTSSDKESLLHEFNAVMSSLKQISLEDTQILKDNNVGGATSSGTPGSALVLAKKDILFRPPKEETTDAAAMMEDEADNERRGPLII